MDLNCTEYSLPLYHEKEVFIFLPYKLPGTQCKDNLGSELCLFRKAPCVLHCHSFKYVLTSLLQEECRKESWQSGILHQFTQSLLVCKRKRKVLISSGHYLATIDNGATYFLCFFHCSKKHAYCLFGVEWPIENVSWREKKNALHFTLKGIILLF